MPDLTTEILLNIADILKGHNINCDLVDYSDSFCGGYGTEFATPYVRIFRPNGSHGNLEVGHGHILVEYEKADGRFDHTLGRQSFELNDPQVFDKLVKWICGTLLNINQMEWWQ